MESVQRGGEDQPRKGTSEHGQQDPEDEDMKEVEVKEEEQDGAIEDSSNWITVCDKKSARTRKCIEGARAAICNKDARAKHASKKNEERSSRQGKSTRLGMGPTSTERCKQISRIGQRHLADDSLSHAKVEGKKNASTNCKQRRVR